MVPRVRGRVGTVEEPPELKGQFCFEIYLTTFGCGDGKKIGDWGPYKTEKEAHIELKKKVREICEIIEKEVGAEVSGKYIDMKTNEIRSWDEN